MIKESDFVDLFSATITDFRVLAVLSSVGGVHSVRGFRALKTTKGHQNE
jgi:hypothetical protein